MSTAVDGGGGRGPSKPAVGLAAGVLGLVIGSIAGGASSGPEAVPAPATTVTATATATETAPGATVTAPGATVTAPRATATVTKTKPAPTKTKTVTVRPGARRTTTQPKPHTDPRFDTCTEAKAHGYGHYRRGVDPEYEWYDDRDNDGVVCE